MTDLYLSAPDGRRGDARPLVGFDFETHLIRPGRLAPRAVCLSLWSANDKPPPNAPLEPYLLDVGAHSWSALMPPATAVLYLDMLLDAAARGEVVLAAQNAAYDLGVYVATCEEEDPEYGAEALAPLCDALQGIRADVMAAVESFCTEASAYHGRAGQ